MSSLTLPALASYSRATTRDCRIVNGLGTISLLIQYLVYYFALDSDAYLDICQMDKWSR